MNEKTYVIHSNEYSYTHWPFTICGTRINSYFSDAHLATQTLHQLVAQYMRSPNLKKHLELVQAPSNLLRLLDDYVYQTTGQCFVQEPYLKFLDNLDFHETLDFIVDTSFNPRSYSGDELAIYSLPDSLNETELVELCEIANLQPYELTEFQDTPYFYALWDNRESQFIYTFDDNDICQGLLFATSIDHLQQHYELLENFTRWGAYRIEGELSEISPSPKALESYIKACSNLNYRNSALYVHWLGITELIELNQLLHHPIIEVKTLSLEELIQAQENRPYRFHYSTSSETRSE